MFNGIIFNQGKVHKISKRKKGINLFIKSNLSLKSKDLGVSISCDGVCLTLVSKKNKILEFYLSNETLHRSKFKKINKGDIINLELPLKKGQNISNYFLTNNLIIETWLNNCIRMQGSFKLKKSTFKHT